MSLRDLRSACVDVFNSRAEDARTLGRATRHWPCTAVAHMHWGPDFVAAAAAVGRSGLTIDVAISELNSWIAAIEGAE